MDWFKNLRIGSKLLSGFIFIALIGVSVGVFAVYEMNVLDKNSANLYNGGAVPLKNAAEISTHFQRMRSNLAEYVDLSTSEAKREKLAGSIESRRASISEYQKMLEDEANNDNEHRALDEYKAQRQKYGPMIDKVYGLVRAGKIAEAREYYWTEGERLRTGYQESIENLFKLYTQQAR